MWNWREIPGHNGDEKWQRTFKNKCRFLHPKQITKWIKYISKKKKKTKNPTKQQWLVQDKHKEEYKNLNQSYCLCSADRIWNASGFLCEQIRNYSVLWGSLLVLLSISSFASLYFSSLLPSRVSYLTTHSQGTQNHNSTTVGQRYFFMMLSIKVESLLFTMTLKSKPAFGLLS